MSGDSLNEVWRMMKDYRLEIVDNDGDSGSDLDLGCSICDRWVMINAHNAPCGCRYCLDCITDNFSRGEKKCPGSKDACKNDTISLNKDINIDQTINRRIMKLHVRCPRNNCQFKDQMDRMEAHLRVCPVEECVCPFSSMGCRYTSSNEIRQHILFDIVSHSKMMLDSVDHLRNEVRVLNKTVDEFRKVNGELNEKIESLKVDKEESDKIIEQLRVETKELKVKESENQLLAKMSRLKSDETEETVRNLLNQIEQLKVNVDQHNCKEFVWKIEKWWTKNREAESGMTEIIYSDGFYSHRNGYKLRLKMYPNGFRESKGFYLAIYFCLMRGEFDDILPWPFKRDVTIELINVQNGQCHTSCTVKYSDSPSNPSYLKPSSNNNIGLGFPKFISFADLIDDSTLSVDGDIFIKCRVRPTV